MSSASGWSCCFRLVLQPCASACCCRASGGCSGICFCVVATASCSCSCRACNKTRARRLSRKSASTEQVLIGSKDLARPTWQLAPDRHLSPKPFTHLNISFQIQPRCTSTHSAFVTRPVPSEVAGDFDARSCTSLIMSAESMM